uniref:NmrA-like domain-containing protein n=1 Tax=Cliftonaea pectinata TaxID=2007206 RepID=A0A1Z1MPK7_9FLOR|nr:hypothetical protein [Cliftonaea pectinata]ARW68023.1 hypothetical protein [Cliftonaea pectinata]
MSLLVIGSTGTLGRQIVKKALNQGFHVKCLVRNFRKAAFLKEWGAELIYGDLNIPETIPIALSGITAVIDSSTSRVNDLSDINKVDLIAKYILIESSIKAKVKRYIFFSILDSKTYSHLNVRLIKLKLLVENRLKKSCLEYTIFSLPGFFQGLIPQYAMPLLDQNSIWLTNDLSYISYLNTQDIAQVSIKSLSIKQFRNKILPLVGHKSWCSLDIIKLCERISGRKVNVIKVPIYIFQILVSITNFFQWTWNISDRLAFINVTYKDKNFDKLMKEILYVLKIRYSEIEPLEVYFQEYFQKIMKKLKELNYQTLRDIENKDNLKF